MNAKRYLRCTHPDGWRKELIGYIHVFRLKRRKNKKETISTCKWSIFIAQVEFETFVLVYQYLLFCCCFVLFIFDRFHQNGGLCTNCATLLTKEHLASLDIFFSLSSLYFFVLDFLFIAKVVYEYALLVLRDKWYSSNVQLFGPKMHGLEL